MTKTWRTALAVMLCAGLTAPAFAQDDEDDDDMDIEGVSGKRLPDIRVGESTGADTRWLADEMSDIDKRPYPNVVYVGARALDLEPEYIARTRDGFGKVFNRDYKGARQHFVKLDQDYPGTGISGSVDTLVWQALMLENFDFRYDKQYKVANDKALTALRAALKQPGHDGWEHFQVAGLEGVEAIHMVRQGSYLPALNLAFDAMDHVQAARKAAPAFTDLKIADGMYNYWRTVVTMSSKMLPDFGDRRAEGIAQIQEVEAGGVFMSEAATLALAFSWLEERQYKKAANACARNRRAYPTNVINNLLVGQTFIYTRHYDDAIEVFNEVRETAPDNNRVYYYLGLAELRRGQPQVALRHFERYLASDHLEGWQKASGHYRLGQCHYKLKAYRSAEYHYKLAVKENGYKPAKSALDRMKDRQRAGKIDY
jgi:TolA-binding protein